MKVEYPLGIEFHASKDITARATQPSFRYLTSRLPEADLPMTGSQPPLLSSLAEILRGMILRNMILCGMDDDEEFEDDEIPLISGSGEGLMDEAPARGAGSRRDEDIALDLMKFVAMTTGYGKTASSGGVGFTGGGSAAKPEEYAAHLLELYGKCLKAVEGAK
jgi:hypothetical protein